MKREEIEKKVSGILNISGSDDKKVLLLGLIEQLLQEERERVLDIILEKYDDRLDTYIKDGRWDYDEYLNLSNLTNKGK